MATKIVVAVAAVLALAISGTVGVAYYNDPAMFDSDTPAVQCSSDESPCCGKSCCGTTVCPSAAEGEAKATDCEK